jgi:excisionase family DNA binding protein
MTRPKKSTLPAVNWLSVEEVAEYFTVGKMTVYRWVHSGELPAIQVGRRYLIDEEAVKRFMTPVVAVER